MYLSNGLGVELVWNNRHERVMLIDSLLTLAFPHNISEETISFSVEEHLGLYK